jgi:oligopeptidase B
MFIRILLNIMIFTNLSLIYCPAQVNGIKPPAPEKNPKELMLFGEKRIDNYYWMNDKKNPKVINYLKAENKYSDAILKPTVKLQNILYKEMINRIKQDDKTVPYEIDGYFYYTRFEKGKEYPFYCRKTGNPNSPEEILLDINKMAKGYKVFKVNGTFISTDNNILAFSVDTSGDQLNTITFLDIKKRVFLNDVIKNTNGNLVWCNDNKTVFYCLNDETVRSYKVFKHTLGTPKEDDIEIYFEADNLFEVNISKSKINDYIFIYSNSTNSSMISYFDANDPKGNFQVLQPKTSNVLYSVLSHGDRFFVRTNDSANNFKIVEAPIKDPRKNNWKDVIPHRPNTLVESFDVFKNFLVVKERTNGLTQIRVMNLNDKTEHTIEFNEETYQADLGNNKVFATDILRYQYTSLTTPMTTFDYNMKTKIKKLVKETEIPGGYNKNNYETKRLFATAADNTKIPISIVYKKGLNKDGQNPLLMLGYGAYGNSFNPGFSSDRLSLLDRGFVIAIAHIRGGQEMGRSWYEDGKMLKKINTFTDFISCAEYLISEKYTNPKKLFANGRSAGGLLMGAVTNMRPELFKGILAEVPWVDVVTDMLNADLPLTTLEYDEWGNPNKKNYYEYMLSYSPYDNVQKKNYPSILATGGLNDTQVLYWNPAKWVAKLRELKTDKNIILLKTNMGAGHSGASGRFEANKLTALKYAFMLDLCGIKK